MGSHGQNVQRGLNKHPLSQQCQRWCISTASLSLSVLWLPIVTVAVRSFRALDGGGLGLGGISVNLCSLICCPTERWDLIMTCEFWGLCHSSFLQAVGVEEEVSLLISIDDHQLVLLMLHQSCWSVPSHISAPFRAHHACGSYRTGWSWGLTNLWHDNSDVVTLMVRLLPQTALEMSREEYSRLPGWKQVNLKKSKGLFWMLEHCGERLEAVEANLPCGLWGSGHDGRKETEAGECEVPAVVRCSDWMYWYFFHEFVHMLLLRITWREQTV